MHLQAATAGMMCPHRLFLMPRPHQVCRVALVPLFPCMTLPMFNLPGHHWLARTVLGLDLTQGLCQSTFDVEPNSGYLSDSATTRSRVSRNSQAPISPTPIVPAEKVISGPTLAERIEEKLRQREEQRDRVTLSDPELNPPAVVLGPPNASLVPRATVSASHSPSRSPQRPETWELGLVRLCPRAPAQRQ